MTRKKRIREFAVSASVISLAFALMMLASAQNPLGDVGPDVGSEIYNSIFGILSANGSYDMFFSVSPGVSGFRMNESGYRFEGNFYPRGVGGAYSESDYKLSLIPRQAFYDYVAGDVHTTNVRGKREDGGYSLYFNPKDAFYAYMRNMSEEELEATSSTSTTTTTTTSSTTSTTLPEGGGGNFTRKDSGYILQVVTTGAGSSEFDETLRMPFAVSTETSGFRARESGYLLEGNFYPAGIGGSRKDSGYHLYLVPQEAFYSYGEAITAYDPAVTTSTSSTTTTTLTEVPRRYVISLTVNPTHGVGENIIVRGTLTNETNGSNNPMAGESITLRVLDGQKTLRYTTQVNSSASGEFTASFTLNESGGYSIQAGYLDIYGDTWMSVAVIRVAEQTYDTILILPDKAGYYSGEAMSITMSATRTVGAARLGVGNVSINGSIRYENESIISSFSCVTAASGLCNVTKSAPAAAGRYLLEANDFAGSTVVNVLPFDVSVDTMDDTGTTLNSVYTPRQSGKIRVRVSYNGSRPTVGTYSFAGSVRAAAGTIIEQIPETQVNATTFIGWHTLTFDQDYPSGSYVVYVTVTQSGVSQSRLLAQGGNTVSARAYFEVRGFKLSLDKESGFRSAYTAFPQANVSFKVTVTDLATGNPDASLTNSDFNATLESKDGRVLATYNITLNRTYYILAFSMPQDDGNYILRVRATKARDLLEEQRTLTVTSAMATATPTDREGKLKELFDSVEYVYIKLAVEGSGSSDITDIELASVLNGAGASVDYSYSGNWSSDDNATLEWRRNISSGLVKLDNPKSGGIYLVTVYLNNKSLSAKTKFLIDAYSITATPQDKNKNQRSQFATDATVYLGVTVTQAQHESGSAMMAFEKGVMGGRGGGMDGTAGGTMASNAIRGSAAGNASPTQLTGKEVEGAAITVQKIINDQTFAEMPLSTINYSCTKTDAQGQATCTLVPAAGSWSGGWYHVVLQVTGPDNVSTGLGHAGFEVRTFYISAYSNNWMQRPTSDLTFSVYMYDAGNDRWWDVYTPTGGLSGSGTTGGLDGRVTVEKILRYGSAGEWTWPPTEYNYSGTLPTVTVKNGQGNITIRAPSGGWGSGSYRIVLRGEKTDASGNVTGTDYGQAWFEIRMWDVYADPVDTQTMQWKQGGFSTTENITLFINIHNAGSWGDGVSLGGTVSVGVKKIEDYSTWPSRRLDASEYTVYPISVNTSASLWNTPNPRYVLTIESKSGRWASGYYNVVLDVNGSETGWGWFEVVAFQASARFVNENGTEIYTARGSGPLYVNVTTYSGRNPINTTVKEFTLRTWSEESWFPVEYKYPGDLNVTPIIVSGSTILSFQRSGGESLPTGHYDGEIVLEDASGDTATARVWFQVKPFEVMAELSNWEVSAASAVNVSLRVIEDYSTYYSWYGGGGILWGNYTVTGITENRYSGWGPETQTNITDYTPTSFNGSANLIINPPDGRWTSGYHNLVITVQDGQGNTGRAWVSFRAQPFKVTVLQYPSTVGNRQNVTVQLSVLQTLNVSEVYEWSFGYGYGGDGKTNYNFTPEELPQGTVNLTIIAPEGGWTRGYETWHSLTIVFTDGTDTAEANVWFEVRSYQASIWADPAGKNQNVSFTATVYEPDWVTPAVVNITGVEYYNWNYADGVVSQRRVESASVRYGERGSGYTSANYTVSGNTTVINGSGTLILIVPASGWNEGWYDVRVYASSLSGSDNATFFTNFQIATCNSECSVCSTETECNRSSASCRWDDLGDNDNNTGQCTSSYGGYLPTCDNDCYSCRTASACNQSSMSCEWSAGSCRIRSLTCGEDCYYCYSEQDCTQSNASTGCSWDSLTKMCVITGSTCSDNCYNCYGESSCTASSANCTWNPRSYYCKPASETCDKACYNCYEQGECGASAANCTWNSMYNSCYEAWQTCDYECGYCYTQQECASSPVGKCYWSEYYCQRNYTCSEGCYYCKTQADCEASSQGCYWDSWGDWCSINWSTCARGCSYCSTASECTNSSVGCEWNSGISECKRACSGDSCSSCDTKTECEGTGSCWWSNISSSCRHSYQNCTQDCSYCEDSSECSASPLNCEWSSGYCRREYTCADQCSLCATEEACNASTQNCRWRSWGRCDYNYACSSGCSYCDTQQACESAGLGCVWDVLDGKCAYSGGTCNDGCSYCYTQGGCKQSNYTETTWGWNGTDWGYINGSCTWDNLTTKCVLEGRSCNDDCIYCDTNASCGASADNCSWDRLNNNCKESGGTCDEYCGNCHSTSECQASYSNCSWDSLETACRQASSGVCNTNCSICSYQTSCNQSAANCTWNSTSYTCIPASQASSAAKAGTTGLPAYPRYLIPNIILLLYIILLTSGLLRFSNMDFPTQHRLTIPAKMKAKTLFYGIILLAVLPLPASAALTVQSFSCNSQSGVIVVEAGGTLNCEASVKNTGSTSATISSISLLTDGIWAEKTSYDGLGFASTLQAGATTTAAFGNIKPTTPGLHHFNYVKVNSVTDSTPANTGVNVISIKNLQLTAEENASEGDEVMVSASVTSGGNTEITLTLNLTDCSLDDGESATRNLGAVQDNTVKSASWRAVMGSGNCTYSVSARASSSVVSVSKSKSSTITGGVGVTEKQVTLALGWNLISLPLNLQ